MFIFHRAALLIVRTEQGMPAEDRMLAFGETALRYGFRHKIDLYCWTDVIARLLTSPLAIERQSR